MAAPEQTGSEPDAQADQPEQPEQPPADDSGIDAEEVLAGLREQIGALTQQLVIGQIMIKREKAVSAQLRAELVEVTSAGARAGGGSGRR